MVFGIANAVAVDARFVDSHFVIDGLFADSGQERASTVLDVPRLPHVDADDLHVTHWDSSDLESTIIRRRR